MYTHTLTSICGALILAGVATVIGFEGIATARPEDGSLQIVNRTQKGDRLPLAQINIPRAPCPMQACPRAVLARQFSHSFRFGTHRWSLRVLD